MTFLRKEDGAKGLKVRLLVDMGWINKLTARTPHKRKLVFKSLSMDRTDPLQTSIRKFLIISWIGDIEPIRGHRNGDISRGDD